VLLIDNFDTVQILPQFIARAKSIYCDLGFLNPFVGELPQFQEAVQQGKVRSLNKYSQLVRWVKSSAELELMRQAAAITSKVCLGCHPSCVSFCSYWPLVLRSSKYCGCGLGLIV
jgi:Xaa-Pro aminopeptidase